MSRSWPGLNTVASCVVLVALLVIGPQAERGRSEGFAPGIATPEPLVIDLRANGFSLTSIKDGVKFDLDGDGHAEQIAWTSPSSPDDAFLALDTTGTGRIENGRKLFGGLNGFENGFTTLQRYEERPVLLKEAADQGTGDAVVTPADPIYRHLIVWLDANHNGFAEGTEMRSADRVGIVRLYTGVVGVNWVDEYGNAASYSAQALVRNQDGVPVATEVRSVRLARTPAKGDRVR